MQFKENEVYTFKLNSGEELISKVIRQDSDGIGTYYVLTEPLSVAPGPQGMGLVPSMFTAEHQAEVRLNTSSISLFSPTEDKVKMKYLEATTGISVPSKKLILG